MDIEGKIDKLQEQRGTKEEKIVNTINNFLKNNQVIGTQIDEIGEVETQEVYRISVVVSTT